MVGTSSLCTAWATAQLPSRARWACTWAASVCVGSVAPSGCTRMPAGLFAARANGSSHTTSAASFAHGPGPCDGSRRMRIAWPEETTSDGPKASPVRVPPSVPAETSRLTLRLTSPRASVADADARDMPRLVSSAMQEMPSASTATSSRPSRASTMRDVRACSTRPAFLAAPCSSVPSRDACRRPRCASGYSASAQKGGLPARQHPRPCRSHAPLARSRSLAMHIYKKGAVPAGAAPGCSCGDVGPRPTPGS